MTTLKFGKAVSDASNLLLASGMPQQEAETTARCIVASDAWGIGSHGLMRLPFYLERLKAGGINHTAKLKEITNLQIMESMANTKKIRDEIMKKIKTKENK